MAKVVDVDGKAEGSWTGNDGFLSDIIKIQDSEYYQSFSYEIIANRMLSTYEKFVRDIVHPSGTALFGRYQLKSNFVDESSIPINFSIVQS